MPLLLSPGAVLTLSDSPVESDRAFRVTRNFLESRGPAFLDLTRGRAEWN